MPSTLTWLDHDASARDRTQRILSLFEERDTRNELGIGAIRDSFSDLLFPGTSTVHTRLRYFLVIPWVYRRIEDGGTPPHRVPQEARELELDITQSLKEAGETDGVFGISVGRGLKTLPSAIYWAGLQAWGIRRFRGSRSGYHASMDLVRKRRERLERARRRGEAERDLPEATWDPSLPPAPEDFPELDTLEVTRPEAEYLQDRVAHECGDSLLAYLFQNPIELAGSGPWDHPRVGEFPHRARHLVEQGRRFSAAMHGASLVYNLLLARAARREERAEEYAAQLTDWQETADFETLASWDPAELWLSLAGSSHRITPSARDFVDQWLAVVNIRKGKILDHSPAHDLVRNREARVKGRRARLRNTRLLEQWGGASSPAALDFRWGQVKVFGNDLLRGLSA